ncbi:retrovirus-related Pol polyprotein from transposon RE2 isoform X2 [Hevea brasiliensis]|uniref:retrovirus-related Pol polyprotein from transposon RE2 isoform X2 n=1 Tax=Hevea brasiliensis TaxID=3981 RepID=UPI0025ED0F9B|nr:retrovirus-related Pol polyprotein from transposon RE2 isoform X2 [Hevea brasiliensis]
MQTGAGYIQDDGEFIEPIESIEDDGGNGGSGSSTPSTSPSTLGTSSSSSTSSNSSSSTTPPHKWRSLAKIYAPTKRCQLAQIEELDSFEEAVKSNKWPVVMDEKMKALEKNKTWELVDLLLGKEVVGLKRVYKLKYKPDGSVQKHKARIVAHGYMQREGIDLKRHSLQWPAFLNGLLEEEVYVQ